MKTVPTRSNEDIQLAVAHLISARNLLRKNDCPKTLARTRLALSSAKGALRNAELKNDRVLYR